MSNLGDRHVPVVVADLSKYDKLSPESLRPIGYSYDEVSDKWAIGDAAADYIYCNEEPSFALPGTLGVLLNQRQWINAKTDRHVSL